MGVSHDDADPVTEVVHDKSWSANLEKPAHAKSRDFVVEQSLDAVEHTAPGNHVNLVTHGDHGHPAESLYEELEATFEDVEYWYVDQCGCGGHVTRVHVE